MSAATVDDSSNESLIDGENVKSQFEDISIDEGLKTKVNREDLSYYYSSGSFNFILENGFKPETLETIELTNVPFLPDWYEGIMSIHGLIVPVVNILKFAMSENLDVQTDTSNKPYLLKLEHKNHKPIIFKLDSIPQLVNTTELVEIENDENTPDWIKHYLENDTIKLASIDHEKLFKQLINKQ